MKVKFKKSFRKLKLIILGLITGGLTGFFGSGGGIIAVPLLESAGLEPKQAHSTSLALTLPLSAISGFFYQSVGQVDFLQALKYVPLGIAGAIIGAKLLAKISGKLLRKIFAFVMIAAGIRLFLK